MVEHVPGGTWQPFCGAYTGVLPMIPGEEQLIISGPTSSGYRAETRPRKFRMPGYMVSQAIGEIAEPGMRVTIPCRNVTLQYILGEHHDGEYPGHDWWEAERWP